MPISLIRKIRRQTERGCHSIYCIYCFPFFDRSRQPSENFRLFSLFEKPSANALKNYALKSKV